MNKIEKDIVNLVGDNHTDPFQFDKERNEVYGLYTYKGEVFCFKDFMDIPFSDLSNKEQNDCLSLMKNKKYVINPALQ